MRSSIGLLLLVCLWGCTTAQDPQGGQPFRKAPHRSSYKPIYVLNTRPQASSRTNGVWYPASLQADPKVTRPYTWATSSGASPRQVGYKIPEKLLQIGLSELAKLIEKSEQLRSQLSGDRQFTLFAPNDEAVKRFFEKLPEESRNALMEVDGALETLLLNHMVPGRLLISDLEDGMKIRSMAGSDLEILEAGLGGITVSGERLLIAENQVNFDAENGQIHVIADVIFPFEVMEPMMTRKSESLLEPIDEDDPELNVELDDGNIRGINLGENLRAWLGIPYAKPPIGDLRFAPPEKVEPWNGQLATRRLPNACQQVPDLAFGEDFEGATMWNPNTDVSEDCLYLSVYAPRNFTERRLPVLVWIYGGGYMTGSSALDAYNPKQLVERGDLIYVAMQYRVGVHGFISFGADSDVPGNMGLKDQVMALNWVQENIDIFGGNPDDVTLMGESAGANSVALHMVSPKSCKLFHKAILQSTGLTPRWGYVDQEEATRRARVMAENVDCEIDDFDISQTIECLRQVDSERLLENEYSVADYTVNMYPFVTTVDGEFLPAPPEKMLKAKAFSKDKPVLLGTNANEGFWSLIYAMGDLYKNEELDDEDMEIEEEDYMERVSQLLWYYPERVQRIIGFYYRMFLMREGDQARFNALDQIVADTDFVCNTESLAQALASNGNDVYRYYYSHKSSRDAWPEYTGVKHGDELEFTFGLPLNQAKLYSIDEVSFAHDIIIYWTNFVKSGTPNPAYFLNSWPKYESPSWKYFNLTAGPEGFTVASKDLANRCEFWAQIVPLVLPEEDEDYSDSDDRIDFEQCK